MQHISAHMNPAICLGLWLLGELSAADFFALSAAELAGAIVGMLLTPACSAYSQHDLPHSPSLPCQQQSALSCLQHLSGI